MIKFSELKSGDKIYCLHLTDNINYDGNFSEWVGKELNVKIDEIKIHKIIYPGIVQTGPYYAITPTGNKATYGKKEDDNYVNIIYFDNGYLRKLILENKFSSKNHTLIAIDFLEGIFFSTKEELDKYVINYCKKHIYQYDKQIKSLKEKQEKYSKFLNAYRS